MQVNMMRPFRAVGLLFILMLAAGGARAAVIVPPDQALFEQANLDYREGRFDKAAEAYHQLTETYPREATFYYNLGNSLYRMKEYGTAILAYERAKRRAPRSKDIADNLHHVQSSLEYHVADTRNWYIRTGEKILKYFRDEEVYMVLLIVYFLFITTVVASVLRGKAGPWGWWRKGLLITFLAFALLAAGKSVETYVMRDAVVVAREAEVRYGPSLGDRVAFRLGEGLKAYVIDSRKNWSRILLTNQETGWVKNTDIAKV